MKLEVLRASLRIGPAIEPVEPVEPAKSVGQLIRETRAFIPGGARLLEEIRLAGWPEGTKYEEVRGEGKFRLRYRDFEIVFQDTPSPFPYSSVAALKRVLVNEYGWPMSVGVVWIDGESSFFRVYGKRLSKVVDLWPGDRIPSFKAACGRRTWRWSRK